MPMKIEPQQSIANAVPSAQPRMQSKHDCSEFIGTFVVEFRQRRLKYAYAANFFIPIRKL